MIKEKEMLHKYVISPVGIESKGRWSINSNEALFLCYDCKSPLFYVLQQWGVVLEDQRDFDVLGYLPKEKPHIGLRVVGLVIYCAECGNYREDFYKYFYPIDKIICAWDDELELADTEELKHAVDVYNRIGRIEMPYKSSAIKYLEKKLNEFFAPKKVAKQKH